MQQKTKRRLSFLFLFLFAPSLSFAYKVITRDFETKEVTVPAHGHAKIQMRSYTIKEDGWLIEAKPMMINAPGYLIHHAIALLIPSQMRFCGQKIQANLFWGAGREHNMLFLPNGFNLPDRAYGIPVKKGQKVAFFEGAVMLYNPDDVDYHNVKFRITATFYVPEAGDPPLKNLEVLPLFLTRRPQIHAGQFCPQYKEEVQAYQQKYAALYPEELQEGKMESTEIHHINHSHHHSGTDEAYSESKKGGHESVTYWIPPRSSKKDSWLLPLEIGADMEVYALLGHVHDYADYLKIYRNGKEVWSAPLVKDKEGRIVTIPVQLKPGLVFRKGDKIMLETKYTNPHNVPVDAMGIALLFVHRLEEGELVRFPEKLNLPKEKKQRIGSK